MSKCPKCRYKNANQGDFIKCPFWMPGAEENCDSYAPNYAEMNKEIKRLREGWMKSECTSWFLVGEDDQAYDTPKCEECDLSTQGENFCERVLKEVNE